MMNSKELYDFLKNLDNSDDLSLIIHCGNVTGMIRDVYMEENKIILSNKDPMDDEMFTIDTILDLLEDWQDEQLEVVVRIPSMGFYKIKNIKLNHYDYSEDNDGIYDEIDVYCEDEPFCGGSLDDLKDYLMDDKYLGESKISGNLFERILNESIS